MKLYLNYALHLSEGQRSSLQMAWPGIDIVEQRVDSVDSLDGTGVVALVTDPVPIDLTKWKDLRWVQLLSAGANHLRGHSIFQTDIPVTSASGTHGVPIAQFVTCTWLMTAHRMPQVMEFKRTRVWPSRIALAGFTIRGLTAGIVGYGSIGRECARQLKALGMRIVCVKRDPSRRADADYNAWPFTGDPEGRIPEAWFGPDELREMLPHCDLVVVTIPSTPATEGMIGKSEFALMKKSARMIIVSRGGIVEEAALADALRAGQLAEAVVDCFGREPLPSDHVFFDLPNLIMTPHVSGVSDSFNLAMVPLIGENLRRLRAGQQLLNQISAQTGY